MRTEGCLLTSFRLLFSPICVRPVGTLLEALLKHNFVPGRENKTQIPFLEFTSKEIVTIGRLPVFFDSVSKCNTHNEAI